MSSRTLLAATCFGIALPLPATFAQDLLVDFNSTTQDGGPHPQVGYQSYDAGHEVIADFIPVEYTAFGTTVTFTPSWPDTTDNRVQQMIDRGTGNDNNWLGDKIDLLTDFIGIDTRTGNGGNGDIAPFPGDTQEFLNGLIEDFGTRMDFTFSGLPAGTYSWRSYHHDTENVNTPFYVDLSTDGGTTFTRIFNPNPDPRGDDPDAAEFEYWEMTNSSGGGNPAPLARYQGDVDPDPASLPSTVEFEIVTDGSDVVIRWIPLSRNAVHEQILGVNGFELEDNTDSDVDGLPDWWERANFDGSLANSGTDDNDSDFSDNAEEYARLTNPNKPDTDTDGLLDGHENGSGTWDSATETGTDPHLDDTDGDGFLDGDENPDLPFVDADQPGSDPNKKDTDGDLHPDKFEVDLGIDPNNAALFPRQDGLFVDFSNSPDSHEYFYQGFIATDHTNADPVFDPDNGDPVNGIDREETFIAFGTDVTLGVAYTNLLPGLFPDEADDVKRMIDRGTGGYDGLLPDLMRDWIGVDSRLPAGNGDFEPTFMEFTFTGLPEGAYFYRAFHHDNGNQSPPFDIAITDADRTNSLLTGFQMTTSPTSPGAGNGPESLPSTVNIVFRSNGTDPVVINYQVTGTAATNDALDILAVNGFQLTEAGDSDSDGLPDSYELEFFKNLSQSGTDDFDMDGSDNATEFAKGTRPDLEDHDGDGLLDGEETTAGTNPFVADSDGDGVDDGPEVKTFFSDPLLFDTDGDGFNDGREIAAGDGLVNNISATPIPDDGLFVDFDSLTQGGGPNNQIGYDFYEAGHEVELDFIPKDFSVFGTTVTFTPAWPDTADNRVMQMIDRGGGNDDNWNGDQVDLLTDWIGVDTRTGQGGNGNYGLDVDGNENGVPSRLTFTFAGLPAGDYAWRSYHHDTENVHADFLLHISTDGGATFTQVTGPGQNGRFSMTSSTGGGNPAAPQTYDGPGNPGSYDPADLPSTVDATFTSTGSDVVFQWTPLTDTAVHRQLFAVNGFELTTTSPISQSEIQIDTITRSYDSITQETTVTITWDAKAGKNYSVFASPDLKNAPGADEWINLEDSLTVGTYTEVIPDPAPAARYYKVQEFDD